MNAIMSDLDFQRGSEPVPERWQGLAEYDRALAENRLTAYKWKKAWADPWSRSIGIFVMTMFAAFVIFVIYNDLIIGR